MALGDQDLGVFFSDMAVTVTTPAGRSTKANFDLVDEMESFGGLGGSAGQVAQKPQITFVTGTLGDVQNGDKLTVDGVDYLARTPRAIGDGKLTVLELKRQ